MSYPPARPGRIRQTVIAGITIALAAAGFVLLHRGLTRSAASARNLAAPGRAVSAPTPAARPSRGPLVTVGELDQLKWTDFYGVELPTSPAAGPFVARQGLAWGFAHTPLGALLAAINIGVRANAQWGPRIFEATIRRQVTGPDAAALLAACRSSYQSERPVAGVRPGQPLGRAFVSEDAFRWVAYSPAAATVDVASAGAGPQGTTVRAATQIEVKWLGGDWRVEAPAGGDWGNSAAPLRSLRGYTLLPVPNP